MHPPVKNQANGIGHDEPTIDCSDDQDMARQEFKNEADVNYMLSRFGITQPRGTPTYGEWDDSIDLQAALSAVAEAKNAWQTIPKELRDKFNNMQDLLKAINNGSLVLKDEDAPVQPPTEEELLKKRLTELEERLTNPAPTTGATQ